MKTFQRFLNWCMAALLLGILAALFPIHKWLAWLLAFFAFTAGAATYFCDPATGNDANNGTAQGTPWAHLPGSVGFAGTGWVTSFANGDKVIVKGGSTNFYQVQFFGARWSGSAAFDSITLQSGHLAIPQWGTTRAIIDENFTNVFALAFGEGGSTSMQGVTLDGFEVRNIQAGDMPPPWSSPGQGGSCCIQIGGNNPVLFLSIRNCYLHDALRSIDNTGHGIEGNQGITNFLIYQNVIGPAIGTKGIEPFSCTSGAISNNLITGCGDHCVALSASAHVDFANNLIITLTNGVHEPTYAFSIAGANFCDVWNNLMFQQQGSAFVGAFNDWKSGIGMYNNGASPSHDNRFVNNTLAFFNNVHNASFENGVAFGGNGATIISNAFFANNIVYNCTNSFGPDALFYSSPLSTNATIKFNDFWSGAGNIMTKNSTQSTVAGFSPDSGTTYASNLQLDAVFTGGTLPSALNASFQPNQGYFALSTSTPSSIRLAGNTVSGDENHGYSSAAGKFNLDIIGTSRANWSMGAYEWASPPASATNASVIILGNTTISGNLLIK